MAKVRQNLSLLIAAHGERGGLANNAGIIQLTATLSARRIAGEIGYGFIKGAPTIDAALDALSLPELIVYPLFLSDGYFTRTVLARQLRNAARKQQRRSIRMLPALGLDMRLAEMIASKAATVADKNGFIASQTTLVLLAHGSSRGSASRLTTECLAKHAQRRGAFQSIQTAFLEEAPALAKVISEIRGPAVIIGLFTGHGLHGAEDVSAMMTALNRDDAIFAGNIVSFAELADVVAAGVDSYWQSKIMDGSPPIAELHPVESVGYD